MKRVPLILLFVLFAVVLSGQEDQTDEPCKTCNDRFRLAVSGGLGYRLGITRKDVPPDILPYLNQTHLGFVMNAGAGYYFHRRWGAGISYKLFYSSTSLETYITQSDGISGYGTISDRIQTHFIGPAVHRRYTSPLHQRTYLIQVSAGYLGFRDKTNTLNKEIFYKGYTLGLVCTTSIDFRISKSVIIGVECAFLYAVLSKYTKAEESSIILVELEHPYKSNQCSVDITLGFRFWR